MNLSSITTGLSAFGARIPFASKPTNVEAVSATQQPTTAVAKSGVAPSVSESVKANNEGGTANSTAASKQITDIRTVDAGDMKMTVITYSDGSIDQFSQVTPDALSRSSNQLDQRNAAWDAKGKIVDRLA